MTCCMLGGGDPTCLCLMASCPPAFVSMTSTIISTIIRIIITLANSVAISSAVQRDESESEREYMARSSRRQWGQSSSDNEEPQPSPAKAKRWTADSSDEEFKGTSSVSRKGGWPTCHSGSDGSQQRKKSRHWLASESASSSDDIWRRGHNVGSARKHVVKETTAKSRPWTQNSSSSTAKSRPWTEINSSSSDGECPGSSAQGSSGVPVQAKCLGKPVVDVTIGAMQLKSTSFTVREKLNSFEEGASIRNACST